MKKILIGLVVAAAIAAAAFGGVTYYMQSVQSGDAFLEGTVINGVNVSGKKPAKIAEKFTEPFHEAQFVLLENGKEVLRAPIAELGYSMDMEALEKTLTEYMRSEKTDLNAVIKNMREGNEFSLDLPYSVDEEAFAKAVTAEALSEPRKENENARIFYYEEDNECRILPEVQGTELKDEDLQAWVRGEIDSVILANIKGLVPAEGTTAAAAVETENAPEAGKSEEKEKKDSSEAGTAAAAETETASEAGTAADLAAAEPEEQDKIFNESREIVRTIPASLYVKPRKTADSKSLQKKCALLNEYADVTVTYIFGDQTETLEFKTILNWLKVKDGEVSVKEDEVAKYVRKLAEKYETRYMERVFTTSWGGTVTFPPGLNEYGYTILEDLESAQLIQDILSGEPVQREPVYQILGPWGDPLFLRRSGTDDMAGTYVEVSIGAQHMWYYINGQLFIESDVVTGDPTLNQDTAIGVFPLAFKESPSVLKGGEGKKKYTTKVQYWMPFYEGQGLHDAWWKTVFGGTEYMGNGSHGCVNLPSWVAEQVYNNIEPGTAIVIYN